MSCCAASDADHRTGVLSCCCAGPLLHRRCNAGVATLQVREFPFSIATKCYSHLKALGFKHAVEAEVFLTRHYVPLMKHAGQIFDTSDKKHAMLKEVNLLHGTDAVALTPTSYTRWDTFDANIAKLGETAQKYASQARVFERAGMGGAQDDYVMDAGAADPSAWGVYSMLTRQEFAAVTTAMLDWTPMLRAAAKKLESWDLDHAVERATIENLLIKLKDIADNYADKAERGAQWRKYVEDIRALGLDIKGTGAPASTTRLRVRRSSTRPERR